MSTTNPNRNIQLRQVQIQKRPEPAPQEYTYGWQRATLLGAFFNGVFLVALSVSILVQAVERFIDLTRESPLIKHACMA